MRDFRLHDRHYGYLDPYIIAEIGVNHEGSLEVAKELVRAAARGGAHAAKFQSYKADLLAAKHTAPAYWDTTKEATQSQHELFSKWDNFGPAEYEELARECAACGIDFMTTPFDFEAVEQLSHLMPAIKVASADITNVPLIRLVVEQGKPVIISTGAATIHEVDAAVEIAMNAGALSVTLLHCVLNYPTSIENAQLAQIAALDERYGDKHTIGYSDHVTPEPDGGVPALLTATLLGARVLEKHFTLDKTRPGNDHYHAVDEFDLARFTEQLARIRAGYGDGVRDVAIQASAVKNARRRIIVRHTLPTGHVLSEADLIPLRSNIGIEVARWDEVVGRTLQEGIAADAPLEWHHLV